MRTRVLAVSLSLVVGCTDATTDTTLTDTADQEVPSEVDGCDDVSDHVDVVVCATQAFLDGLSSSQLAEASYDADASVARTNWSNLPGVERAGIALGDLDDTGREAALNVARALLTDEGYADLLGILAADDLLGEQSGGGGPGGGGGYSSDLAHIAVFGTPSTTGSWSVAIGNHHMAFNVAYVAGEGFPTPNHLGVEPKGTFVVNGETYAPLDDDGLAMKAVFDGLETAELSSAFLSGQVFADVVLGPDEFGTGSLSAVVYPTSEGVLVSDLTSSQQALVTAAIEAWVRDFDPGVADPLVEAYTSADAYAQTRVAWGGTQGAGVDLDTSGTYMRIDGPRVWIEVAMQSGVIMQGTHFHTMYRDKESDYGGTL